MGVLTAFLPAPGTVAALTWSTAFRTIGRGMFLPVSVIYFTGPVGLSAMEVGFGLSFAAVFGFLGGLAAGRLSDLRGPRGVTLLFSVATSLLTCGYVVVDGLAAFVLVTTLTTFTAAAEQTARSALIGVALPHERRVQVRAYLRAVTNVGLSLGGLGAAFALHHQGRAVYLGMMLGCSVCYLAGALLILRVPPVEAAGKPDDGPIRLVLRDRPYITITLLNAALSLHGGLLTVALPLWVVQRTSAPAAVVALLIMFNTVAVTMLQVPLSRGSESVVGAARAQRRSGWFLLMSCLLFALSTGLSSWVAVVVLVAGASAHVAGELFQAAGSWGLSYELAPARSIGTYQGVYGMGYQLADLLAPALLVAAVIGWGQAGWVLIGVIFLIAGALVPPVARRAIAAAGA
ncbi:MFS transporter [Sinosporangium siamense]|uniref:MFS transporter n=1 Tax=Sinosporangium siamense TaxID=1367973 RepID=A0A919RJ55_9ACTN|nr:MFS transporter [Sinosporangium siamense]GII94598.1 MFS transporter [Sinosporangium siamense]